jgi:hypothetical protein
VEETFKKYIYDKPAPTYPECPYSVEYPHRTRRFSMDMHARKTVRRALTGIEGISRWMGRSRENRPEEGLPPGSFGMFM